MSRVSPGLIGSGLALLVLGCATASGPDDLPEPPHITVSGVSEGGIYDPPVMLQVSIDRGAYQAQLDGEAFSSGSNVSLPGPHVLEVSAHVGLVSATLTVHFTIRAPAGGVLIIRMFNLGANDEGGGGDAILVSDSSGAGVVNALVDAGPAGANGSDPGFVARQLAALHADTLAFLLLTHAHGDHYGGMSPVLSGARVRRFLYNGQVRNLASYNSVLSQAALVADSVIVVTGLRDYQLGFAAVPSHLTFIPPLTTYLNASTDDATLLNDGSVGARLDLGSFSMLFTGDGEVAANNHWRATFPSLIQHVTVLKVGHHGANNAIFDNGFSGNATWLDQTLPEVSIVSSNGTTHPRINALNRLLAQPGNQTYCTSVHGNIEIRVARSGSYTLSVQRNAGLDCVPGSGATT